MKHIRFVMVFLLGATALSWASPPPCDGPNRWAATMVFVHLKNAGVLTKDNVDFDRTKVTRLASEEISEGLHRQVHKVVYYKRDGSTIKSLAVNVASHEECSLSGVKVYIVSKELGNE